MPKNAPYSIGLSKSRANHHEIPNIDQMCKDVHQRDTPSSLDWPLNSELWKDYTLIVRKGEEPYLDLPPRNAATDLTPARVYLGQTEQTKDHYPCHKNVHGPSDSEDLFACDYNNSRRSNPGQEFARQDHFREHYRDYHKEDLGQYNRVYRESKEDLGESAF